MTAKKFKNIRYVDDPVLIEKGGKMQKEKKKTTPVMKKIENTDLNINCKILTWEITYH